MKTLSIDIETYSPLDLKTQGVYKYTQEFEILLFGYAFDDEEVKTIDLASSEELPREVKDALTDPEIIKTAFNATFERTCINAYFNIDSPARQWRCSSVAAREMGLPGSLEAVGEVLGLPIDKQKLKTGKQLISYFSMPCKPTKKNGGRTRNLPEHDKEKWELYKEYNIQDVVAEREIRKKLPEIRESEQELWIKDQEINDRGVKIDVKMAEIAVRFDEILKEELLEKAKKLTGLENPKSTQQMKPWIENKLNIKLDSIDKKTLEELKGRGIDEVIELRKQITKTSISKYKAMLNTVNDDGRIRGLTQFYGANRTGRWAGRLVQLQNLPQNKIDIENARQILKFESLKGLDMVFGDVPTVLSQLVRTAFIPETGYRFIVSDFSAIEARVLAWLADEQWRLDVFKTHGKIYEASAEQMFKLPKGSVKKDDPIRQKGKIAELALGYGGSVGAMKSMGAIKMGLKEEELLPIVNSWRESNPAIVQFWNDVDMAVKGAIQQKEMYQLSKSIYIYTAEPNYLKIRLPSGREIVYVNPKLVNDRIMYEGTTMAGNWGEIRSYGAKFVENIVQATARDCLAEALMRLENVVFHVHDEVILEMPFGASSAEEVSEIMSKPISWAPGLPLRADAFECRYYKKE